MNVKFPRYTTCFSCDCALPEATQRLQKAVACEGNYLKIVKSYFNGIQTVVLSTSAGYRNSFMPIATIEMGEADGKAQVSIVFELRKSTKVIGVLLCAVALLIAIAYFIICTVTQPEIYELLIFLGAALLIAFVYAVPAFWLYIMSRSVLKILFTEITREDVKRTPAIHKIGHTNA